MEPHSEPDGVKPRPDYPPKTPPPPRKPPSPSPPRPNGTSTLPGRQPSDRSGRPVMRNRQGAAWSFEAQPWAAGKALSAVTGRLAQWGVPAPEMLEAVVRRLVAAVVADGGRHVSFHAAEQDRQVLLLAFSHQPAAGPGFDVLEDLRRLGAVSCGMEMTGEGRRVWAVLE
ncbi:hypothetical protein SUDANB145_07318 (plasmid) [Streptomyces sp. enrichment culture]|uniref:hypothetical protein n=1 Tax=Streptomyces sp. enrichment culture TaxID=1795815 RepID=UPI003F56341F